MPGSNPARQNALLLVALLFAQLLLMSGSVRQAEGSTMLERTAVSVSQPVVSLARSVGNAIGGVVSGVREMSRARVENERLRQELSRLRSDLNRRQEEEIENRRLRRLLDMKEYLAPISVGASIVSGNLSNPHIVWVDRGSEDGVTLDCPVVAWGGLVGRVILVGKRVSKVQLISDHNSGVAGRIQRNDEDGIVLGQGGEPLEMAYVPAHADVRLGDRVVSSGRDGVFPPGYGIGTVTEVSEFDGVQKSIKLKPEVEFAAIEEVLLLVEVQSEIRALEQSSGDGR